MQDGLRQAMVQEQLRPRGIEQAAVLDAMSRVPRERFLPPDMQAFAYDDRALPVGFEQTISQPYMVALMTQLARPTPASRALDVGTGTGYQAAVLGEVVSEVFTIEIVPELATGARERLETLGYSNIRYRVGDGSRGWPEAAPFDLIIAAAAPTEIPGALLAQLKPGGRLVIPIGDERQRLVVVEKDEAGELTTREISAVAFVPMTGGAGGE